MNTQTANYAHRAAVRRSLVFESQRHESATERRLEAKEACRLLTQAAVASVRAGEPAAANDLLAIVARLEAAQP